MPISDYAHWNEEAVAVWYQEEGRFPAGYSDDGVDPYDDYYDDDDDLDPTDPDNQV